MMVTLEKDTKCLPPGGRKARKERAAKQREKLAKAIVHQFFKEYTLDANIVAALERTKDWFLLTRRNASPEEAATWDCAKPFALRAISRAVGTGRVLSQKVLMSELNNYLGK